MCGTVGEHFPGFFVEVVHLHIYPGNLPLQFLISISRSSLKFIFQLDPFKMKRAEDGIYFFRFSRRNKISTIDKTFISFAFYKDRTQVIHEIFLHFMIMLCCDPTEAVSDEPVAEYLMQITFQWTERCNDLLLCTELLNFIFAFFLFLLQIFIICTCISHKFKHIVQTEG